MIPSTMHSGIYYRDAVSSIREKIIVASGSPQKIGNLVPAYGPVGSYTYKGVNGIYYDIDAGVPSEISVANNYYNNFTYSYASALHGYCVGGFPLNVNGIERFYFYTIHFFSRDKGDATYENGKHTIVVGLWYLTPDLEVFTKDGISTGKLNEPFPTTNPNMPVMCYHLAIDSGENSYQSLPYFWYDDLPENRIPVNPQKYIDFIVPFHKAGMYVHEDGYIYLTGQELIGKPNLYLLRVRAIPSSIADFTEYEFLDTSSTETTPHWTKFSRQRFSYDSSESYTEPTMKNIITPPADYNIKNLYTGITPAYNPANGKWYMIVNEYVNWGGNIYLYVSKNMFGQYVLDEVLSTDNILRTRIKEGDFVHKYIDVSYLSILPDGKAFIHIHTNGYTENGVKYDPQGYLFEATII